MYLGISIHSLVKRETAIGWRFDSGAFISIHSLVKRETNFVIMAFRTTMHFNPLPRKEGDLHAGNYVSVLD